MRHNLSNKQKRYLHRERYIDVKKSNYEKQLKY